MPKPRKSNHTREHILDTALALFRKRGFDATTMRDVAAAAGLSLGLAYYYFRSKDAIVSAYYLRTQDEHERRARTALAEARGLRERLGAVLHAKLDVVRGERQLLGVIFRAAGDPSHPLSVFAPATRKLRAASVAIFDEALAGEPMPADLRALLGPALWMLHLGVLLQFIHDASPRQRKSRQLVDGALDLVVPLIALAKAPQSKPIRDRVADLVRNMGWSASFGR